MNIIKENAQINTSIARGVALGNFDGIHIGHQELLNTLVDKCNALKIESCIYTFDNHPLSIINNVIPSQITNFDIKNKIFESLSIDTVVYEKFDKRIMKLNPQEFMEEVLVEKLHAKIVVVGFDFRFGFKGEGDVNLLSQLGKKYDFTLYVISPVKIDSEKVSSSLIKRYIKEGNMTKVKKLMRRYFSLEGVVVKGKRRGRELGFPTANISIDKKQILPKEGVYATYVNVDGKTYFGATSIGKNPTFSADRISIETFILEYDGSLYGKKIGIEFVKKLRNQIKFDNIDALKTQLSMDVESVKKYLHYGQGVIE
ncbi:MAG: bifunctional riboflavin kinase/FAD synthetase [Clostridiales bacterium]|nr:bifunctional riboflavin kinase/FAD synthetase [Clostridiales bacterium]